MDILRNIFSLNGYPDALFNSQICYFIDNIFNKTNKSKTNEEYSHVIILPYFGLSSKILKRKLIKFNQQLNLNVKLVFRTFKTANYFTFKSKCPTPLRSSVIYQYCCSENPDISYIGMTKRNLLQRVKEHKSPNSNSAVLDHLLNCNCKVIYDNFKILHQANDN